MSDQDDDNVADNERTLDPNVSRLSSVKLALEQLRPVPARESTNKKSKEASKLSRKKLRVESKHSEDAKGTDEIKEDGTREKGPTDLCDTTIVADCETWGVSKDIAQKLEEKFGITRFFSLQQHAIHMMIENSHRDVCVSAPTGSGKTLIYAIPLVHALSRKIVTRCRGLVLVPSRELAHQVHSVVQVVSEAVGLKCGLLAAESSLAVEGKSLVRAIRNDISAPKYAALVDIVVATPGRLLDHLNKTKGFTLEHLEILVVDEADRMLTQSYNDWLDRVYQAASSEVDPEKRDKVVISDEEVRIPDQRNYRPIASNRISVTDFIQQDGRRLRRILCSATLTSNPQKLAALALLHPMLIDSVSVFGESEINNGDAYKIPKTLKEVEYKVTTGTKPLVLLHVITELFKSDPNARVLVFASAVERATRVFSMLKTIIGQQACALMSSDISRGKRAEALEKFKNRKIRVLVASDLAARGIDVQGLEYVVSYDVPAHSTTFVHRAGRTARAGLPGTSIVLLREDQARHYRQIKSKLNLPPLSFTRVEKEALTHHKAAFDAWKSTFKQADGGADSE